MLFRNKYRIESSRCPKWDYSSPGYYFITSVTHNRVHFFGKISNGEMLVNEYGAIANEEWYKTGEIRDNIVQDEFVVMPNHIHGIIRILPVKTAIPKNRRNKNDGDPCCITKHMTRAGDNDGGCGGFHDDVSISAGTPPVETPSHGVSTNSKSKQIHWKPGVLGAVIGQFKIKVTKRIRKSGMDDFNWQFRFHDHIIRGEKELFLIRQYIRNNPADWEMDDEFNGNATKPIKSKSPWYVQMP